MIWPLSLLRYVSSSRSQEMEIMRCTAETLGSRLRADGLTNAGEMRGGGWCADNGRLCLGFNQSAYAGEFDWHCANRQQRGSHLADDGREDRHGLRTQSGLDLCGC